MASRQAGMSARRAAVSRKTLETAIEVELRLDGTGRAESRDRHRLLRPHARRARQARPLRSDPGNAGATSRSTITTPSRTAASRSARRSIRRSASAASRASARPTRRWTRLRAVVDLSAGRAVVELGLARETLGALACENRRISSLACDRRAHGAAPDAARRQRPPPRRGGVQGRGAGAAPGGARRWPRRGAEHERRAVGASTWSWCRPARRIRSVAWRSAARRAPPPRRGRGDDRGCGARGAPWGRQLGRPWPVCARRVSMPCSPPG